MTLQAIILGIIQGLTELLPISSSAHLYLVPWFLGWTNSESFQVAFAGFDVALHLGTLLAIGIYFFQDWISLIKGGILRIVKKEKSTEGRMFWYIIAATIPGGAIGFLLDKFVGDYLQNPIIIAIALMLMGILLYIVDIKCKSKTEYENMNFKQTFFIGLSQCLAFIPGASRSGTTMTAARFLGVKRESAAKYSFMLSAPIVFIAAIYKFKDFLDPIYRTNFIESGMLIPFIFGILTSFLVGLLVIKFLLEYLRKKSFKIFAIYRMILGIIIIGVYFFMI